MSDETISTAPIEEEKLPTQVAYRPRSQGRSIETVCPPAMATPTSISLDRVEAVTGQSIDEFVAGRLGIDQETMFSRYAAEQIDCLSIAYLNQDRNRPTLIANDTGTGKGRIVSGVIAPVLEQEKIAVFITAQPELYVDMLARDMVDTGIQDAVKPFFTDSGLKLDLTSPNGAVVGRIETPAVKQQGARIQALIDEFKQTGTLGEYNCVFTTYAQLKDKGTLRRDLLETIAPNATFVLDECDLGGGASGAEPPLSKKDRDRAAEGKDVRSVSQFLTRDVLPNSDAYVLLSATAFKDPHVLSRLLSPKSEIRETGLSQESLAEKLVTQGIPGQQDFTNKLALSGELVRLEKSMEGITFQTEPVPVDLEIVNAASAVMSKIVQFDRAKQEAVFDIKEQYAGSGARIQGSDGSEGKAAVESVNFTSTAYNFQQQFLLFLKADAIAQRTIESIEAGRKPEVIFFNTMQAVIEEHLSDKREDISIAVRRDLKAATPDQPVTNEQVEAVTKERYQDWLKDDPAPEITLNIGSLLERQLDKCCWVTIIDPYGDRERHYLSDAELGYEAVALDGEIREMCHDIDWSSVKISGVDSILQRVSDAGYSIAEMSGRSVGIDYSDGTPRYRSVDAADREVRAAAKNGYNNGENDALIANVTTGWSGHASRNVNDQRQREAILAQAHPDGNKMMQSLGRVNRVGQVDPAKHQPDWTDKQGTPGWGKVKEQHGIPGSFGLPVMTMVYADGVAYEERITANINRKMASLNANTTGSRSSGVQLGDVDFMNSYGDQVAWDLMSDDPELHEKLDFPLGDPEPTTEKLDGAMMRVTGRSLFLPLDEQRQLFDSLKQNFTEYIAQREAIGESPMEAKPLDLKAKTIGRIEIKPATSDSLFGGATCVEIVQARSLRKPFSSLDVANQVRKAVGLEAVSETPLGEFDPISQPRSLGQAAMDLRLIELEEQVNGKIAELNEKIVQKTALRQEQEPVQSARVSELQAQLRAVKEVQEPDKKAIKEVEKSLKSEERSLNKLLEATNPSDEKGKQNRLAEQWKTVKERLELCPVGQPVRISDKDMGCIYGVVTDVKRVEGVKNPLAGGAWKIKIAVADAAQDVTLKLSDINIEKKVQVVKAEAANQYTPPFDRVPVHQLFDDAQKEKFETRQIVTGNLLSSPVGKKYINFTNAQGQGRQGLLLPRGYDIEKALEKAPVVLRTRQHQEDFLAQTLPQGGRLQTTDEALNLMATARAGKQGGAKEGWLLEVPSGKRGGKYYKDADLMELTSTGEFEKNGKWMKGFIPADRSGDLLSVLERKFPDQKLAVSDEKFKPTARGITGDKIQSVEWFKDDQPLDLAAAELEFSAEGIADRITAQKAQSQQKAEQQQRSLAFQEGDLDAAQPEGQAQNRVQHPDLEKLTQAFEDHFANGGGFDRITDARKFAISYLQSEHSDLDLTLTNKQVDESVEKSLVRVAREITQKAAPLESFDQMVELYDRQPNLSSRTSTSIINQQYSTPVPIGRLVQQLGDITPETTVYEPTAGNGSLLSNADPKRAIVNELDSKRASELKAQGFEPTTHDATEYAPEKKSVERVILNPPFGRVSDPETGRPKRWMIELDDPAVGTRPYETSAVDHAISFKALSAMQDDGKAVLVLGAPMEQKMGSDASESYNEGQTRSFFYTLYNNYNVTNHFTVAGDLYGKQGTTFPIDVVVINGRGKSELDLPAVTSPPVYRSWEELREVMKEAVGEQEVDAPILQVGGMAESQPQLHPEESNLNSPDAAQPVTESELAEVAESTQLLLPAQQQFGGAEKNVAKLLCQSGLAEAIVNAPGGDFHLRIENEPYLPLVVERHNSEIYLTHYRQDYWDGLQMDGEMVFHLSDQGALTLSETAVQNPFTGGESRGVDRSFAQTFSRNLLDQGFAVAARRTLAELAQTEQLHIKQAEFAATEFLSAGNLPLEVLREKPDFKLTLTVPDLPSRNQLEVSKYGDDINFSYSLADGICDDHISLRFELSGDDLKLKSTYIKDSDEFTPQAATGWIEEWAEKGFDKLLASDLVSQLEKPPLPVTEVIDEATREKSGTVAVANPVPDSDRLAEQTNQPAAIASCTIPTAFGDIKALLFNAPDDFLRLEVEGATVNWTNYPDSTLVAHIPRESLAAMDAEVQEPQQYVRFAAEQCQTEFFQQLSAESERISPSFHKWLQSQDQPTKVAAAICSQQAEAIEPFMDQYPERQRSSLTPAFMQLAVQANAEVELARQGIKAQTPLLTNSKQITTALTEPKTAGTMSSVVEPEPATVATAPLKGDDLKKAVVQYLAQATNQTAGLATLQEAMGYPKRSLAAAAGNPVNQMLKELRDEGKLAVIQDRGEPRFMLNAQSEVQRVTENAAPNVKPLLRQKPAEKIEQSPTLQQMRDWLIDSKLLGKDNKRIERVRQLCIQMVEGTPQQHRSKEERDPGFVNPEFLLSPKAWEAIKQDSADSKMLRTVTRSDLVQWYQQAKELKQSPEQLDHIRSLGLQQIQGTAQESLSSKDRDANFKNPNFALERQDFLDKAVTLLEHRSQAQEKPAPAAAVAGRPLGRSL